jgi:type IV pilus assembly protein PilM
MNMANQKLLGFDIGSGYMKIALCEDGLPSEAVCVKMPDHLVKDGRITSYGAMADFIKEQIQAKGIHTKNCAVSLPADACYIRRSTMPKMTVKQLAVNIPYEFHEFITEEISSYFYDYAVLGSSGKEMDLLLVAAKKKMLDEYNQMFRRARLKLQAIVPEELCYGRLLRNYERTHGMPQGEKDYVILDLGHGSLEVHFFRRGIYEVTRSLEPGCAKVVEAIANVSGTDEHSVMMREEYDLQENEESDTQELETLYGNMAMQVMRVLNFYSFNNPDNNLDRVYYCGGGSCFPGLMDELRNNIEMPLVDIAELMEGSDVPRRSRTRIGAAAGATLLP